MTSSYSTNPNLSPDAAFLLFFDLNTFLIALMVESTLYGIYLITLVACFRKILRTEDGNWKRLRDINWTMVLVVVLMFCSSSLNLVLLLVRKARDVICDSEEGAFMVGKTWSNILRATLLLFQSVLADSVLLYRCWLIRNKRFVIVSAPLVCWMGALASGGCALYSLYTQSRLPSGMPIHVQHHFICITVFWACTILINVYCTGIILSKIYSAQRAWIPPTSICSIQDLPQICQLRFAKRIIIESGFIYTTMTLILFINHVCQSRGKIIAVAAEIQVTGIAFNLLLSRAAQPARQPGAILPTYRGNNVILSGLEQTPSTASAAVITAESEEGKL